MLRTALRLGIVPLLATWLLCSEPMIPFWEWMILVFLVPFIAVSFLLSCWRLKKDLPQGVIPLWARKLSPYIWGVCALIMLSVPLTSWPLHRNFRQAKPELERLLADEKSSKNIAWPQQIGQFEVLRLETERGESYFYLSDEAGESPTTLIHSASLQSPERKSNLSQRNSVVILSDNWIYSEPFDLTAMTSGT